MNLERKETLHPIQTASVLASKVSVPVDGDCPYTLFLGAGASLSSGIPTAQQMVSDWKAMIREGRMDDRQAQEHSAKVLRDPDAYLADILSNFDQASTNEYATLFEYLFQEREERQMYIEELVANARPGYGYYYLSGLIHAKRFNRVLTTNFDDLLNDALRMFYEERPIVCAFDSAVSSIRIASQRPKIVKLHGDFLFDSMKHTNSEIRRLDENMELKMRQMCQEFGLIVVGYSGSDESILAPLREMVRKSDYLKMGLHWCLHLPDFDDTKISIYNPIVPGNLRHLILNHPDRVHLYSMSSFDNLMEMMFHKCGCIDSEALFQPHQHNTAIRFLETVKHTSARQHLTPKMVSMKQRIVTQLNNPTDIPFLRIMHADTKWETAKELLVELRFSEAQQNYEEAESFSLSLANDKDSEKSLRVRAFARLGGCRTGLAKTCMARGDSESDILDHLNQSIDYCKQGISLYSQGRPPSDGDEFLYLTSCYYNLLCCLGLKALRINDEKIPDEITKETQFYFHGLSELDRSGERSSKLILDEDFARLCDQVRETRSE